MQQTALLSKQPASVLQQLVVFWRCKQFSLSLWLIGAEPETVISRAWLQSPDPAELLHQDYWRACFEINFSDRQEGLTVSSIICDR